MTINDIWGTIRIEPKFLNIINSKEIKELKNKTQLGLNCNANATHTRYQHSIGTYFLASRLIEICKAKFSDILDITVEDEDAIKCFALVHDIGHGCFSHVSEKFLEGTHEERTEKLLLNPNSEIHQAIVSSLGENVLKKTIELIKMKETIKEKKQINNNKSLMFIIAKLLSGGIDIDRIDYIFRDSKQVTGEINDFAWILESIELESIDGALEVVFNQSAEFKIANFFNKRFELYDVIYLELCTQIMVEIFGKFLEHTGLKLTWDTTEIEMNNLFREYSSLSTPQIQRYAALLSNRNLDNGFIIKEVSNKKSFDFFLETLYKKIPELPEYSDCIFTAKKKVSVYNQDNKVLINNDGLIKDISECSQILNSELQKETFIFAVDLQLLRTLMTERGIPEKRIDAIIDAIQKALSVEIEQEKKYILADDATLTPEETFAQIKDKLKLENPKIINNVDTYYDCDDILESYRIAVRRREKNGYVEWTVKRPLNDKSSISKRDEKNFTSKDEVIAFLQTEWNIPITELHEVVTLRTKREKYDLEHNGNIYEICFDVTTPSLDETEYDKSHMIECELKKGSSTGLFLIDEIIKSIPNLVECNRSKKEIALDQIRPQKQSDIFKPSAEEIVKYEDDIKTFFIGNPKLFDDLKELQKKKDAIRALRDKHGDLNTPLVVTITGTPRAGKTTCVDNLADFLKKADLRTTCLTEPAEIIYSTLRNREEKKRLLNDRVGFVEKQFEVGSQNIAQALDSSDVIVCDRGNLDPFIWYRMYHKLGMISDADYEAFLRNLNIPKEYFNQFFALYSTPEVSQERDYVNSLSLEPRTTVTRGFIELYNSSMLGLMPLFKANTHESTLINTSQCDRMDASIQIADQVLERVRKLY